MRRNSTTNLVRTSRIARVTTDIFAELHVPWASVSARLATGYRISATITALSQAAAVSFLIFVTSNSVATPFITRIVPFLMAVIALHWFWRVLTAGRVKASWGYYESEKELIVKSGLLSRRLVVVPFGRMQFIEVSAGPIASALGYSSVTLKTASTQTAATIPGIPTAEAHRLRDSLNDRGESHGSGI